MTTGRINQVAGRHKPRERTHRRPPAEEEGKRARPYATPAEGRGRGGQTDLPGGDPGERAAAVSPHAAEQRERAARPRTLGSLSRRTPGHTDRCFPSTPEPSRQERSRTLSADASARGRGAGCPTAESARRTRTQEEGAVRSPVGPRTRASPPRRTLPRRRFAQDARGTVDLAPRSGGATAFRARCRSPAALAGSGSLIGGVAKRLVRECC